MKFDDNRERRVDAVFNRAIWAYEHDNFSEAISLLEELLNEHSEYVIQWDVNRWLGLVYFRRGDYNLAIERLELAFEGARLEREDPELFGICYRLGTAYMRSDKYLRSIEYYQIAEDYVTHFAADEWVNDRYLYRLGKGRCYVYLGKYKPAIVEFEKARLEIPLMQDNTDADYALIGFEMGRARLYDHDVSGALAELGRVNVRNLGEDHVDSYRYIYAIAHYDIYDYLSAWQEASRIDISAVEDSFKGNVYNLLGKICYHRGGRAQAKEYLLLSLEEEANADWVHKSSREFLAALDKEGH